MNKQQIFSLWYKQPAMLTSLPEMALMIKKEGVEGYGLYMIFADSLHISGGYRENNFDDISLVLDCSKKKIKMKLKRVLDDYNLFDYYVDDDGVEKIGLQRVREDVETLTKQKLDGAKGGRKRANNQVEKQINEVKLKEEIPKEVKEEVEEEVEDEFKSKISDSFKRDYLNAPRVTQINLVNNLSSKTLSKDTRDFLSKNLKPE